MTQTRTLSLLLALLMLFSLFAFTACQDDPAGTGDPANTDESAGTDDPANTDETESTDDPANTDESTGTDDPANTDETESTDDPANTDESAGSEETPAPEPKKSLKVLTLGNSFSEDAHRYLINIMKAQGMEEVILGNLVFTSCSLAKHLSHATNNTNTYFYYKFTTSADRTTSPKYTVERALADEEWDIVILQQVSGQSGVASTYGTTLDSLVSYIKERVSEDCQLGWHMTWAYQSGANHSDFSKYSRNQMTMYNSILSAVQEQVVSRSDFNYIIPAGTAIQNARTSYFGDTLTRDGYHLSDLGRYIVGYTWYYTLTGNELTQLDYTPDNFTLTDKDREVVLESVLNAAKTPFAVTDSQITSR